MITVVIKELDPVYSQVREGIDTVRKILSYKSSFWKQGQYRKERKEYVKTLITRKGFFFTGHKTRIDKYCKKNKINLVWMESNISAVFPTRRPTLEGIVFLKEQKDLIRKAIDHRRGVLLAPTGFGKSLIALGYVSCFPKAKVLFLCHTLDLLHQIKQERDKFGIKNVDCFTIQTFVKKNPKDYGSYYDIVIIDEVQHLSKNSGMYGKVLSSMIASRRLGLTATLPDTLEAKFTIEGMIGQVIGEVTIQEGNETGILAIPRIKIIKVPFNQVIKELRSYNDVYEIGIVNRKFRNELIVKEAKRQVKEGKSVLIMVVKLKHGNNILKIAEQNNLKCKFVHGITDKDTRVEIKEALKSKKIKCVISSVVWREGVNIPSLDVVINAAGGKSELVALQAIGRGLRRTKEKEEVLIVDFFDESHYFLVNHFGNRISLYSEMGWI